MGAGGVMPSLWVRPVGCVLGRGPIVFSISLLDPPEPKTQRESVPIAAVKRATHIFSFSKMIIRHLD